MHLFPSETEKLLMAVAGMIARDRLSRGVLLNYPETVALLSTWVIERAREGASVEQLMAQGSTVLSSDQVLPEVPGMLYDVQVEATFPDGRKLVTLHHPLGHGQDAPGEIRTAAGTIEINVRDEGDRIALRIENTGDRPVQIGSHIHLPDTNSALAFDRAATWGFRLDIPSGTSVRFEPGVARDVEAVRIGGAQRVPGIQIKDDSQAFVGGTNNG